MGCEFSAPTNTTDEVPVIVHSHGAHKQQSKRAVHNRNVDVYLDNQPDQNVDEEELFEDPDFPANADTLTKDTTYESYEKIKDAVWRRPTEFMKCHSDEVKIFDKIDVNDIKQGFLGNCYFLASLSGLAEVPERVKALFVTSKVNKSGKYSMRFYVRGVPTVITIDDRFPCWSENPDAPLFSSPEGKELWAILLEKAWAKLFKGYINTEAGWMEEALENLTGAPSLGFETDQEHDDEIWSKIKHADAMGHIIGAGTRKGVQESTGLVEGHAYTIIAAYEVEGYRLLKLRNPWGQFEWKGDFSDSSELWTESLKKAVGYEEADDGVFFMELKDFRDFYRDYSIHYCHDNWHYSYVEQKSGPNQANYYKFSVDKPCEAFFRIHQEDSRSLPKEEQEHFQYSPASFAILKVEEDGQYSPFFDNDVERDPNLAWGNRSLYITKDGKVEIKEAGEYIIRAEVDWRHGNEDTYTVSAYSSAKIDLKAVPSEDGVPN